MPPLPKDGIFEVEAIISTKNQSSAIVSHVVILSCCHSFILPYYHTATCTLHMQAIMALFCCHTAMLSYCHVVIPQVQWEWQDNDGCWRPYSSLNSRNLEVCTYMYMCISTEKYIL